MCGRFVQASAPSLLVERFDVDELVVDGFEPHYNVAPRMDVLVVRNRDRVRSLGQMRWGLVPMWADSPAIGDRMINARSESVTEKAAFKGAFERRRCLIPVDGFYEWQAGSAKKVPMYIHAVDDTPLAFAGLWETWRSEPEADPLHTCTVITTVANTTMASVHDRMPAVLDPVDWDEWLDRDPRDLGTLERLLRPAPDDLLTFHPVSTRVNSARNDDAALLLREDPLTLFP